MVKQPTREKYTPKDIAHFAYLLIRDAGICTRCLHAFQHEFGPRHKRAGRSATLCTECLAYWREQSRQRRNTQ